MSWANLALVGSVLLALGFAIGAVFGERRGFRAGKRLGRRLGWNECHLEHIRGLKP